jgi:AGZA family xanthine/uracil permease-like MFS transporter
MRWIVRGDIDGFFGLALDNLVQLLLIQSLCQFVLVFPPDLIYGRVLPGAAVSILVGNLFYSHQARNSPNALDAPTFARCHTASIPFRSSRMLPGDAPGKMLATQAGVADPAASPGKLDCSPRLLRRIELPCVRCRTRPQGAPRCSRRSPASPWFISLASDVRPAHRRPDDLRHRHAHLLRSRAIQRTIPAALWPSAGTLLSWIIGIAPSAMPGRSGAALPVPVGDLLAGITGGHLCRISP